MVARLVFVLDVTSVVFVAFIWCWLFCGLLIAGFVLVLLLWCFLLIVYVSFFVILLMVCVWVGAIAFTLLGLFVYLLSFCCLLLVGWF